MSFSKLVIFKEGEAIEVQPPFKFTDYFPFEYVYSHTSSFFSLCQWYDHTLSPVKTEDVPAIYKAQLLLL